MSKIPAPSAIQLNDLFPREAYLMERTFISMQLRKLGVAYKMLGHNFELTIEIPTTDGGYLRIKPANQESGNIRRFYVVTPSQKMRLPGNKVVKIQGKELVIASVEYCSSENQSSIKYILKEENFAEILDTAIESFAQIDQIRIALARKNRALHPFDSDQIEGEK